MLKVRLCLLRESQKLVVPGGEGGGFCRGSECILSEFEVFELFERKNHHQISNNEKIIDESFF
jgi:hypothetical protein